MKILLVDDEYDILEFLSYNLKKEGFVVKTANNGKLAVDIAQRFKPDLIILDVMMPYKDGFTLAKEIREVDDLVPLIFLTAKTLKEDVLKGFKLGADDYLTKPFDSEVLLAKIKSILGR